MLSILIPVYNVDVTPLVHTLCQQGEHALQEFEIICIDDASKDSTIQQKNRTLHQLSSVTYIELEQNIGRGKIRMLLAEKAQFEALLFMDCDMKIISDEYLKKYAQHINKKAVIGGIAYQQNPPKDLSLMLRWKYGIQREQKSASERNRMRFSHFVASNLLINKKLFMTLPVDNDIIGYGHEDTLLGLKLLKLSTPLSHIDNPVEHLGIDSAAVFLEKSKSGTANLATLYLKGICSSEIRLINTYETIKAFGMVWPTFQVLKQLLQRFENNLKSTNPAIRLFDLWKLYYFMYFLQQHKATDNSQQ